MSKRRVKEIEEIQEGIWSILEKYLGMPIKPDTHLVIRNQLNAYLGSLYHKQILTKLLHSEVTLCLDPNKIHINAYYFDLKRNIKVYIDTFEDVMLKEYSYELSRNCNENN